MSIRPNVFFDTSVILKAFGTFRNKTTVPDYMSDLSSNKFTFEKCVYECYMAFRGVGGKKPDEGRGDWAQRYLKSESDPLPIGTLISKYHEGSRNMGHYWINQIQEAKWGLDSAEELIEKYVIKEQQAEAKEDLQAFRELAKQRGRFEEVCDSLFQFLMNHQVTIIPYISLFGLGTFFSDQGYINPDIGPEVLDRLVRDTIIPSEDFEIVYAAMRIPADILVTDDSRLKVCAMSLGLNLPLSPAAFCGSDEYKDKLNYWSQMAHA